MKILSTLQNVLCSLLFLCSLHKAQAQITTIQTMSTSTVCSGAVFNVTYAASGTFVTGNVFKVELSDTNGSFVNATTIGTLTSLVSGTIVATVPALPSNYYLVRISATNPNTVSVTKSLRVVGVTGAVNYANKTDTVCSNARTLVPNAYQHLFPLDSIIPNIPISVFRANAAFYSTAITNFSLHKLINVRPTFIGPVLDTLIDLVFRDANQIQTNQVAFKWYHNGSMLANTEIFSLPAVNAANVGQYVFQVTTNCNPTILHADTFNIQLVGIGFSINKSLQCLTGNLFIITDTSLNVPVLVSRKWDFGDGTRDSVAVAGKTYATAGTFNVKLLLTSTSGCNDSILKQVVVKGNNLIQPICLVTVDSATQKNKIIWERINKPAQASYHIYKETSVAGTYSLLGTSPADSAGLFIDTTSNPGARSDRYKLTTLDTCGNESVKSDAHKTMHLTVNSGLGGVWNLIWESYEGKPVNTIHIYRGSSPATMSLLTSVPGTITTYTDLTPPTGILYYMTSMDFGVSCDPARLLKTAYTSTQSNVFSTNNTGLKEEAFLEAIALFPNPVRETLNFNLAKGAHVSVRLFDGVGKQLLDGVLSSGNASVDMSSLAPGVYMVALQNGSSVVYKKVVKQ